MGLWIPILLAGGFLFVAWWEGGRIWADLLVASFGLLGVGLGAVVLLALFSVTGARWSDVIRPAVERLTLLLPLGSLGVALVLVGQPSLYSWINRTENAHSFFQTLWLNRPFFLLRSLGYLVVWNYFALLLVQASRLGRRLVSGTVPKDHAGLAGGFLVVFAITFWLASIDWIMSLEPKWTSTIFGIYNFAGMFLGALAALVVVAYWFDRRGYFAGHLTKAHWHDLGTLLFSFSSFWMYIWFSQYMLIWYVNNPEETDYFVLRQGKEWQPFFLVNLLLNWGIPFVLLLFRPIKECPRWLLAIAVLVIAGRFVDLYLMVLPAVIHHEMVVGPWEAGLLLITLVMAGLIIARPLPVKVGNLGQ